MSTRPTTVATTFLRAAWSAGAGHIVRAARQPRTPGPAAFTLIELMIAISLGMVIMLTVMAGFRVASQSMTTVSRLATENQLMRLGVERAHEYLDFWQDYDDPLDTNNQPLRGNDMGGGLPFTPMKIVAQLQPDGVHPEKATGWDAEDPWPMSDPRVWWHGNVAESETTNLNLGRYALFANTATSLDVTSPPLPFPYNSYGHVTVLHSWLYNQLWSLHNALGYYGYIDYTPANTMYGCYMPYSNGTNGDGEPTWFDHPGGAFASTEGPQHYPHGLYRLTMGSAMALTAPFALTPTNAGLQQPGYHQAGLTSPANGQSMNKSSYFQQYYYTDYLNNQLGIFNQLNQDSANITALFSGQTLPPVPIPGQSAPTSGGPATWSNVSITIQRFIKTNRFVNVCRVICISPLTGQTTQLVWDGFGTTLRGARLQRRQEPDKGWVQWDDPQVSPPDRAANLLTLDDPAALGTPGSPGP
jgi:hypothetical protein